MWIFCSCALRHYQGVIDLPCFLLLLLYNKYLCKHVTARYYLYLGNVENFANHFRNAPVGGHTCLTAGEQGEPAD